MTKKLINHLQRLIFILVSLLLIAAKPVDIIKLSDPTRPPDDLMPANSGSSVNWQNLAVSAIFIKPTSRTAIINGQTYHEGDALGEYVITNINDYTVELIDKAHNKQVLQLAPSVKKAITNGEE